MTAGGTETPDDFSGLLFPILGFRTFAQISQCLGILIPFFSFFCSLTDPIVHKDEVVDGALVLHEPVADHGDVAVGKLGVCLPV